jgi:hypothetical protein
MTDRIVIAMRRVVERGDWALQIGYVNSFDAKNKFLLAVVQQDPDKTDSRAPYLQETVPNRSRSSGVASRANSGRLSA